MNTSITIVRKFRGVGIDRFLNGYNMETENPLPRKVYHGRMVYMLDGKQIGLPSIMKECNRCNVIFNCLMPF